MTPWKVAADSDLSESQSGQTGKGVVIRKCAATAGALVLAVGVMFVLTTLTVMAWLTVADWVAGIPPWWGMW